MTNHKKGDPVSRANSVVEELIGIMNGGFVGTLSAQGFILRGSRDLKDGKLCICVVGHRDLIDPQWKSWVMNSLHRAGALSDVAEKIWEAGLYLQDMGSGGSLGRATKPYAFSTVMFLDELLLKVDNMHLWPDMVESFQKRISERTFTALDLAQMLDDVLPISGGKNRGIAQTGGDQLYKQGTVQGYGVGAM